MKKLYEHIKKHFKKKRLMISLEGDEIVFDMFDENDKTWGDRFEVHISKIADDIYSIIVYKMIKRNGRVSYEKDGFIEFSEDAVKKKLEDLYLELKIKKL